MSTSEKGMEGLEQLVFTTIVRERIRPVYVNRPKRGSSYNHPIFRSFFKRKRIKKDKEKKEESHPVPSVKGGNKDTNDRWEKNKISNHIMPRAARVGGILSPRIRRKKEKKK